MPRLAYFSPLPPLASGIADYSAELLPHLAGHFEIEVFTEEGYRPDEGIRARFPVHSWRAFAGRRAEFDAALYQMGNNGDFHGGIYRTLLAHPGIVVLHEVVLHHMIRELTLVAGDAAAYLEEVRYCCGRSGQALARRSLETGVPLDAWSYPLFERVVDASLGVLVHSRSSLARVLASRPLAAAHAVPFPWVPEAAEPAPRPPAELRAALGLPAEGLLVAAFGFMTRSKRLDVALRAFARLCREVPDARFLVVGEVSKHYDLDDLVPPEVRCRVVVAGRVEMRRFLDFMAVADIAVNLRFPDAGETSATLIRLLGMGKPAIVTDAGSFSELPDDVCAKVDPDESEEDLVLAYLRALAADGELRRRMGENARRHVAAHHRVEETARAYAEAVREILAAGAGPFRAAPPLAPSGPEDVLADVVAEITAGMVDLGAGEADEDLLSGVAEAIRELDLDRPGRRSVSR